MRAADPDSPYSWAVAAATLVLASLSFGAANSLPMLFPELSAEFGWDGGSVASLYGATMAGAAVSSLLMGRLLDRIGFFPIGVVATLAMCGGMALASVATARWQFYLIYAVLIGGLGQGAFLSTVAAAVSQWFLRSRGFMGISLAIPIDEAMRVVDQLR
ncbi:MFS transporter, partial [Bordetella bronchiseptica]